MLVTKRIPFFITGQESWVTPVIPDIHRYW